MFAVSLRPHGLPPAEALVQSSHIGLAGLSLMSAAAETQPLVCIVDDAQRLDGASAQRCRSLRSVRAYATCLT
jgi:hypothetical protein